MDVTNVVDDHPEGERSLVIVVWELLRDAVDVVRCLFRLLTLQKSRQIGKRINYISICRLEIREVLNSSPFFIKHRLVDKMPVELPHAECLLDVICEGGTLSKWMVPFVDYQIWLTDSESVDLGQGGG